MITKLSALLALTLVTTPLAVQETSRAAPPDLEGMYAVEGTTDQGPYRGLARIQQRGRAVFVVWALGDRQLAGLGLITGNSMAASYAMDNGIGVVAVYRIEGTRLVGEWPDGKTIRPEILTKQIGERTIEQ